MKYNIQKQMHELQCTTENTDLMKHYQLEVFSSNTLLVPSLLNLLTNELNKQAFTCSIIWQRV